MAASSLDDLALFIDAVRAGGVRALARHRGVPRSTVSRALSRLEAALGVQLVSRGTGRLKLTEAGEACFDRLGAAIDDASAALSELGASGRAVRGLLRVTSTPIIADTLLPELVATFIERHREARVEVVVSSERLDLEAAGVDVAIRAAAPPDSDRFVAKKWGAVTLGFYASPAYLTRHGAVTSIEALLERDLLVTQRSGAAWVVDMGARKESLRVSGRVHADSIDFLRLVCERGGGVARLPAPHAAAAVSAGRLVPVLEASWLEADLHLVYRVKPPAKVRAFLAVCADART